jgi:hypothetical protein
MFDRLQPAEFVPMEGSHDVELALYTPLPGVSIKACAASDADCESPTSAPVTTDEAGVAQLAVPGAFDGYYDISNAELEPATYYPMPPTDELAITYYVAPLTNQANNVVLSAFKINVDPDRGHIAAAVYDCDGRPLADAAIEIDAPWELAPYFSTEANSLPTDSATGARIFLNVPAGTTAVTTSLNGRRLGSRSVNVRPKFVTLVDLRMR